MKGGQPQFWHTATRSSLDSSSNYDGLNRLMAQISSLLITGSSTVIHI